MSRKIRICLRAFGCVCMCVVCIYYVLHFSSDGVRNASKTWFSWKLRGSIFDRCELNPLSSDFKSAASSNFESASESCWRYWEKNRLDWIEQNWHSIGWWYSQTHKQKSSLEISYLNRDYEIIWCSRINFSIKSVCPS